MDYLDLPPDANAQHAAVPFVATHPFPSDCPFLGFPEACGYSLGEDWQARDPLEIADFLQSWLFFGVISMVAGRELQLDDFKSPSLHDGSRSLVDIRHLRDLIRHASVRRAAQTLPHADQLDACWDKLYDCMKARLDPEYASLHTDSNSKLGGRKQRQFEKDWEERRYCLKAAHDELVLIEYSISGSRMPPDVLLEDVVLSVRVLLHYLDPSFEFPFHTSDQTVPLSTRALRRAMLQQGWCVSHWYKVCTENSYPSAYLISRLPRPSGPRKDHSRCTTGVCAAWASSDSQEVTKHVKSDCACSTVGVDTDDVCQIILKGQIPMISIKHGIKGQVELKLEAWNGWTPYVAISHVWADGLGNPEENALPQCQLRVLDGLIRKAHRTTKVKERLAGVIETCLGLGKNLFWLDTLCVPTFARNAHEQQKRFVDKTRTLAIDSMSAIYANATHCLVLDSGLKALSIRTSLPILMFYVGYCGWTTRSWTLQEGCLPRSILFALADGIFDAKETLKSLDDTNKRRMLEIFYKQGPRANGIYRYLTFGSRTTVWLWNEENARPLYHACEGLLEQTLTESVVGALYLNLYMTEPTFDTTYEQLLFVWNILAGRHTTKPDDLPLIFANLLRFRASEVTDRHMLMPSIIGSLPTIPFGLLCNDGPRMKRAARGKAATCMSSNLSTHLDSQKDSLMSAVDTEMTAEDAANSWVPTTLGASILPRGPPLRCVGNVLKLLRSDFSHSFGGCEMYIVRDPRARHQKVVLENVRFRDAVLAVEPIVEEENKNIPDAIAKDSVGFCLLVEERHSATRSRKKVSQIQLQGQKRKGALLAIKSMNDSTSYIATRFLRSVTVTWVTDKEKSQWEASVEAATSETGEWLQPEVIDIEYDRSRLGRIHGRMSRYALGPLPDRASEFRWISMFLLAWLPVWAGIVAIPMGYQSPGLHVLMIVPVYGLLVFLFSACLLRQRRMRHFSHPDSPQLSAAVRRIAFTACDHAVNSPCVQSIIITILSVCYSAALARSAPCYRMGITHLCQTVYCWILCGSFIYYKHRKILKKGLPEYAFSSSEHHLKRWDGRDKRWGERNG